MSSKVKDIFVTAAAVCGPSSIKAGYFLKKLSDALQERYAHYEILVVSDASSTVDDDNEIAKALAEVDYVRHLKVFGKKSQDELEAIAFENAIGDVVVVGNFDDVLSNFADLVDNCCSGNDVVFATAIQGKKPFALSILSKAYRHLIGSKIGYNIIPSSFTGLCAASRRAINAAVKLPRFEKFPFLRLASAVSRAAHIERANCLLKDTTFSSEMARAVELMSYNTVVPARVCCLSACIASAIALLVAVSMSPFAVLCAFTALCMSIAVSLLNESLNSLVFKEMPSEQYAVEFEKHSSVMLNTSELNIRSDSTSDTINLVQTGRDR